MLTTKNTQRKLRIYRGQTSGTPRQNKRERERKYKKKIPSRKYNHQPSSIPNQVKKIKQRSQLVSNVQLCPRPKIIQKRRFCPIQIFIVEGNSVSFPPNGPKDAQEGGGGEDKKKENEGKEQKKNTKQKKQMEKKKVAEVVEHLGQGKVRRTTSATFFLFLLKIKRNHIYS